MIFLTGDVHHQSMGTADQRFLWDREGLTETQIALRFIGQLERYSAKATLFYTGLSVVQEPDDVRPALAHPLVEIGGHTHRAFEPQLLHRIFKKVAGSYLGPRGYQRADIRRCVHSIERASGMRPISWRNHAYHHDANTNDLLREAGLRVVSDDVDAAALGAVDLGRGLISLPINVLPDHEHLYHGPRTAPRVAAWARRYRWSDSFGERSYVPEIWCDLVLEQLKAQQTAGLHSVLMLHPLCQYLADGFRSLKRILDFGSRYDVRFTRDALPHVSMTDRPEAGSAQECFHG